MTTVETNGSALPGGTYVELRPGDTAPWFRQRSTSNDDYVFDTAAGRWIVLGFIGSSADAAGQRAMAWLHAERHLFDDSHIAFFGLTQDPGDKGRLRAALPGIRWFWDFDRSVARLYGAAPTSPHPDPAAEPLRRFWTILDPSLRVRAVVRFAEGGSDLQALAALLSELPPVDRAAGIATAAPILYLPQIFEPDLCARLIQTYDNGGGELSGFMVQHDGRTKLVTDPDHKTRRDVVIENKVLISATRERIRRRVLPQIERAHQFKVTRMERYLVACYDAADQAHFRPHRDNTTSGTAHRRFAVSINLNDDFEGGDVGFPEYGPQTYRPPVGGAVVFSCSLLHRVTPVTRGRRYAFLPFLYDEAAAAIREANLARLDL